MKAKRFARYSTCVVVGYVDRRGVHCLNFIHAGDRIKNVVGNTYTVTGLTDRGITIKDGGWNLGEVVARDLVYYFRNQFWNLVIEEG